MAWRLAQDIPRGSYVNLGIGLPTKVAAYIESAICHSENGVLGVVPVDGEGDPDLINASKEAVGLMAGGSFFDHATSFAMIRGGHIDISVMGAFQVSGRGDLANWSADEELPAVGGAMDLAVGARRVFVLMRHMTRTGQAKVVEECSYPLTARGVVERIYTDLAVLRVSAEGLIAEELAPGITPEKLRACTAATIEIPDPDAAYRRGPKEAVA